MGIGRAVSLKFAEEKARIVIMHYDPDDSAANETLKILKVKGVESESHRVDVSSFEAVGTLFKDIISRFKRVDVLVNNAGITKDTLLMRMNEADWDAVINVNLKSVFNCSQAVVKFMIKQRSGSIVNISSVVGQIGNPGQANYSASKAGQIGFTKALAREVARRNITVNAIAPGFIKTDIWASVPDAIQEHLDTMQELIPLNRVGQPEDIAKAVTFLASDDAAYITGHVLTVDGGLGMY